MVWTAVRGFLHSRMQASSVASLFLLTVQTARRCAAVALLNFQPKAQVFCSSTSFHKHRLLIRTSHRSYCRNGESASIVSARAGPSCVQVTISNTVLVPTKCHHMSKIVCCMSRSSLTPTKHWRTSTAIRSDQSSQVSFVTVQSICTSSVPMRKHRLLHVRGSV